MYRKILPMLLLAGGTAAFGQAPTLTASNVGPVINDQFITIQCDTTGITQGAAGSSLTWDFSALTASTTLSPNTATGTVLAAASGYGYSTLAAAASLLLSTTFSTSTYATVDSNSGVATYYFSDATKISETGTYVNSTTSGLYTDALDVMRFPFTMGTTFNDTYAGALSYMGTTATETGSDTVTGDGYGTLKIPGYPTPTPAVTYLNVLRVKTVQTYRDSANIFGTPTVGNYIFTSYTWYQAGYHAPLLTITTASGPGVSAKTVSYAAKQTANHENVPVVTGLNSSVNIYPNPASGYIFINYNNASKQRVATTLLDMAGRQVAVIADQATEGPTTVSYNGGSLPKGTYIVKMQSGTETTTRKVTFE